MLMLPALVAWAAALRTDTPRIAPAIPTADRSAGNRVFLERAERLLKHPQDSFMILVGDVVFTKGPMIMKCDSCHYYSESESLNAFGNVSMEQGDTLFSLMFTKSMVRTPSLYMPTSCSSTAKARLQHYTPTSEKRCAS